MNENENNENKMKELINVLIDLVKAKTKESQIETKMNIQYMKDNNIDPTVEFDSQNNWSKKFNEDWG